MQNGILFHLQATIIVKNKKNTIMGRFLRQAKYFNCFDMNNIRYTGANAHLKTNKLALIVTHYRICFSNSIENRGSIRNIVLDTKYLLK